MASEYLLQMKGIVKRYPGVTALKGVDLNVRPGTVHCLVGENGAGKSTLIKIITCAEQATSGELLFHGVPFVGRSVRDAMNAGISTVFQELNVVEQLTVAENLTLGRETHNAGIIKWDESHPILQLMREFAPDIPLDRRVSLLSFAEKQIVEIVKAVGTDARLIIMDEPTAALSLQEIERIYSLVRGLRQRGISIIYISHLLDDIFALGDEITVLRDGEVVGTRLVADIDRDELIRMMIGKSVTPASQRLEGVDETAPLLEARSISTAKVQNLSFTLHKGEILGFYGLRGAGKTETARALFGIDALQAGELLVEGVPVRLTSPSQAISHGISMVPEERLSEGLFMKLSISDNIAISAYKRNAHWGVVDADQARSTASGYMKDLNIRAHSIDQKAATLSGGNQQKVVIAKCLNAETKVLLLDEPTRGIDVGSKEEIYDIVRSMASRGFGVVVFSSEFEEISGLCDRVVLLSSGQMLTTLSQDEMDPQRVRRLTMDKGESDT